MSNPSANKLLCALPHRGSSGVGAACDSREYVRTSGEVPLSSTVLTGCKSLNGGAVRDVAEWIRGTLASRREAKQPPPGNGVGTERLIDDDGLPIHALDDEPTAAILFVGSTTEPGPAAAPLASGHDFPRVPFAEDGIFTVDAESGTVLETLIERQVRQMTQLVDDLLDVSRQVLKTSRSADR